MQFAMNFKGNDIFLSLIHIYYGITEDDLELYGKYKAKFSDEFMNSLDEKPDGKLVLMTAINPTPAGEGKTTTSIGLAQALEKLGKKSVLALREPSLGPCFGIKGGAAGGGYSQVVPMEDLKMCIRDRYYKQLSYSCNRGNRCI